MIRYSGLGLVVLIVFFVIFIFFTFCILGFYTFIYAVLLLLWKPVQWVCSFLVAVKWIWRWNVNKVSDWLIHVSYDDRVKGRTRGAQFAGWSPYVGYAATVWPRAIKFRMVTQVEEGRVSKSEHPHSKGRRPSAPHFWTRYWCSHGLN